VSVQAVKLNDWELAGYVRGPVDSDARLLAAVTVLAGEKGSRP
jgi:hypothetical protein